MRQFKRSSVSIAALQDVLAWPLAVAAQSAAPAAGPAASQPAGESADAPTVVVVTGQLHALQAAQKIKQDAKEIVDSVVAEDIGKLADRSVSAVLQRVTGVSLQGMNLTDALYKQLMQQHVGVSNHNYFTFGRRYAVPL